MTDDSTFAELMRRSSLGSPTARSTIERVPAERAEAVRQITRLRNVLVHSASQDELLVAARELVGLLSSLGFSWREEIPEEVLLLALHRASDAIAAAQEERDRRDRIMRERRDRKVANDLRRGDREVRMPGHQPDGEERRASADRPLSEAKFLTVSEAAALMRISKMTVYRLVHDGVLPAIRVGRSFRVAEEAVLEYLRESQGDRREVR